MVQVVLVQLVVRVPVIGVLILDRVIVFVLILYLYLKMMYSEAFTHITILVSQFFHRCSKQISKSNKNNKWYNETAATTIKRPTSKKQLIIVYHSQTNYEWPLKLEYHGWLLIFVLLCFADRNRKTQQWRCCGTNDTSLNQR